MRSLITTMIVCTFVVALSLPAHAALVNLGTGTSIFKGWERSGNLIYEDTMDVTWYDWQWPANSQERASSWADALEVTFNDAVLDNWRLPTWAEYKAIYDAGVFPGSTSDAFDNLLANRLWLASDNQVFNFLDPNNPQTVDLSTNANALAVTPGQVPIPGAVWLLGTGLLGLIGFKKRKDKN